MRKPLALLLVLLIVASLVALLWPGKGLGDSGQISSGKLRREQATGNGAAPRGTGDLPGKSADARSARPALKEVPGRVRRLTAVVPSKEEKLDGDAKGFAAEARVQLGQGQSLLSGGYLDQDGRRVFTVMTPRQLEASSASPEPQVMMSCAIVALDPRQMNETGLSTLIGGDAGERGTEFWSVDDGAAMLRAISGDAYRSRPTVILLAGQTGTIQVGSQANEDKLEFTVNPGAEGGFDLETAWRFAEAAPVAEAADGRTAPGAPSPAE